MVTRGVLSWVSVRSVPWILRSVATCPSTSRRGSASASRALSSERCCRRVARREGIDPVGVAILAAIPYAASLLAVTAGRIGPRVPAALAVLRMIGAIGLALVLLGSGVVWVVAAASIFWLAHMFGMPTQQRLWGIVYPEASRGRMLSLVATGRYAAAGVALLVGGFLASEADGALVIAAGGIIGAVLALATSRIATQISEPWSRSR